MKKISKKVISLFLAFFMILSVLPFAGLAENAVFSITAKAVDLLDFSYDFYYEIWENNIKIIRYMGDSAIVEIPSEVEGIPVTSIEDYAFSDCKNMTSVTIPESVTNIGGGAFENCTGLTSVVIPDSVTSIGSGAFMHCTGLTSITIPDSVTSIGSGAFMHCTGLTNITIPDSVTSIEDDAFYDCTGLTSITLPDSVTSIEDAAFEYCTGLTSITIPDSVTNIGSLAFRGCTELTSITIPDSVTSIGVYTFQETAYYNNKENWQNGILYINNHLIEADPMYISESIAISQGTKTIAYGAFDNCRRLTSITIPDSITSISSSAFIHCTGLTNITIPDSVTSIDDYAFAYCSELTCITIPDIVTNIGTSAFYDCTGLTNITIPDSVTSIGSTAFAGTAYYDNTANWQDGLLYINNHLIKADPMYIAESIAIRQGTKTIAEYAFYYCTGLTNITIPDSITSIGGGAFADCSGLTSIIIPDSVRSIEFNAFRDCTVLTNIVIPSSVTNIGSRAFSGCANLETVYYTGTEEEWNTITIDDYNSTLTDADIIFNYNPDAHSHSYIGTETTPATCETDGLMTYTCSCGESYTEVITKTGHTPASFTQPANCVANGYTITTCSVCGKQLDFTVIPSGGHTYGEWTTVTPATCMTKGLEERNCTVCGKDRQTRETDALGHSFSEWKTITPATIMNEGKKERVCSVCKLKETEIIPAIEVTETKDNASGISVSFDDEAYDGKEVVVVAEEEYVGSQYLTQSYDRFDTWNITTYVDGEKAQPDTPVMVKIPLPAGYNPSMIAVFHVNSNNGTVEKIDGIEIRDGYICFIATSFSLYIVVDESSVTEPAPQCNCRCHKTGFSGLLWKILRFFYKLFGKNQVCACGDYHY